MSTTMTSKRRKVDAEEGTAAMIPTICVMGATGVGKGSTLNSCFRCNKYSVSHMFASDTTKPIASVLRWRGTGRIMRGVDLCGFSDSEGRDTGFIEAMVSYLRSDVTFVNCFLLLLNSQEPRIGMHLKDMLVTLKTIFGVSIMKNVLVGFTRWDYTKKAAILRRAVTKESLTTGVNRLLRDVVGHDHDCECVFLDNTVNMCSTEELQELYGEELPVIASAFDESLEAIRQFTLKHDPFYCTDLESTLAERDVGRDRLERETGAYAEGEKTFQCLSKNWDDMDVEEPEGLVDKLESEAQKRRDTLNQYLAAKTKPDLEHVKAAVLASFDAKLTEKIKMVCLRNRNAASSFNRKLRIELVEEYRTFINVKSRCTEDNQEEKFQDFRKKDREIISRFVCSCKGGSLSWGSFAILQEELRWEQLIARGSTFGENCMKEKLPDIREALTDARALSLFLDEQVVPAWLVRLARAKGSV